MAKNLNELWDDNDEIPGTYFSKEEKSPDYEKAYKKLIEGDLIDEGVNINSVGIFEEFKERPLTEKEIQAQRRASRFNNF
jgi:hypothetical protein